jgi:hypothetical protein
VLQEGGEGLSGGEADWSGVMPLKRVPGIPALAGLAAHCAVKPGLLWLAASPEHHEHLARIARRRPTPWALIVLISAKFAICVWIFCAYPGVLAFSPLIYSRVEALAGEGAF